ncbi:hypothetical protein Tco_1145773 [Tanacetum coccineum]
MVTHAFNIKNSMSMLVQKLQDHKKAKDHKMMIRDYAWLMISRSSRSHSCQVKDTSQSLKVKRVTTSCSQDEVKKSNKIKVVFNQARREEASFEALMRDVCCSLWVSLSKKRRLAAELEALGEQGDVVRALENMKEIVSRDSVTLADLE